MVPKQTSECEWQMESVRCKLVIPKQLVITKKPQRRDQKKKKKYKDENYYEEQKEYFLK